MCVGEVEPAFQHRIRLVEPAEVEQVPAFPRFEDVDRPALPIAPGGGQSILGDRDRLIDPVEGGQQPRAIAMGQAFPRIIETGQPPGVHTIEQLE